MHRLFTLTRAFKHVCCKAVFILTPAYATHMIAVGENRFYARVSLKA